MIIKTNESLCQFRFWGNAVLTAKTLTLKQLEILEDMIDECFPEGIDEVELNDYFSFGEEEIADVLGFENWDALCQYNSNERESSI